MSSPAEQSPWRLTWDDGLSLGIPTIDADHQRFVQLINELNEAIIARMAQVEIQRRLQALKDDAAIHFAHEEALFREWGYPDAAAHARLHADILRELQETMERLKHSVLEREWVEAGLRIKQILINHLLHEDMKCRDCWRQHNKPGGEQA